MLWRHFESYQVTALVFHRSQKLFKFASKISSVIPDSRKEILFILIQNQQINRNKLFNVSFMSAQSKHE